MTTTRVRWALVAAIAVGAVLVVFAFADTRRAWRTYDEAQLTLLDHARALDEVERDADRQAGAEAARALSRRARDGRVERAEAALATCLGDAACAWASAFEAADAALAAALRTALTAREDQEVRAIVLLALGTLLLLLAPLLLLLGLVSPSRTGRVPQAVAGEDPAEVRAWLEELYALRRRVAESDRFVALGEVAAGLSHGLKTPLAVVRAAAQTAMVKLDDQHPAAQNLDDIVAGVDRLTAEVNRFLRASEAGAPTLVPVEARTLLAPIEERYRAPARERDIHFVLDVEEGLPPITADAALLGVALRNLVENALEAAPDGSTLRLSARICDPPARVGLDRGPPTTTRFVELSLEDEAGGVPSSVAAGARRGSEKVGGSGLGLAIARRAVERHGGALELEDTPTGTRIRCRLPAFSEGAEG